MAITVRERNGSRTIYGAAEVNLILDACSTELAMNFDVPAERIIGIYACKLGITPNAVKQMLCDRIAD